MSETVNHRNKAALGAALVVALIALAGVGYAASHSYTGETVSAAQKVDIDYVVVKLTESDADTYTGYTEQTEIHGVFTATSTTWSNNAAVTTYTGFVSDVIQYHVEIETSVDEDIWTGSANDNITLTAAGGAVSGNANFKTMFSKDNSNWTDDITQVTLDINNNAATLYVKLDVASAGTEFVQGYKTNSVQIGAITFTATAQEGTPSP